MSDVNLKDFADGETVFAKKAGDWLYDEAIAGIPMLVWMNKTRTSYTSKVRKHLGYMSNKPMLGEPIISRETKRGLVNNESGEVVESAERKITAKFGDRAVRFIPYLEDVPGVRPPKSHTLRFGYACTAHTAQGSEYPTILVDMDSYTLYKNAAWIPNSQVEARKWLYTAATRAKSKLIIVIGLHAWLQRKA